jgi:hypothetical protein
MLAAVVCGLLCGARGYEGLVEWLHDLPVDFWHFLGFTRWPPKKDYFRDLAEFARLQMNVRKTSVSTRRSYARQSVGACLQAHIAGVEPSNRVVDGACAHRLATVASARPEMPSAAPFSRPSGATGRRRCVSDGRGCHRKASKVENRGPPRAPLPQSSLDSLSET